MSYGISMETLKGHYRYKLNVHIRRRENLRNVFDKKFYKAEWIGKNNGPIVLIEMKGNDKCDEILRCISLDHKHIIKTYGLVQPESHMKDKDSILLLQEYAKDGDLSRLLTERIFIPTPEVLLEIFIQVADAMVYLAQHNIVHGDLACRNVVVLKTHPNDPKENLVKLIDFGSAQNKSTTSDIEIIVPDRYAAPEIIRSEGRSGYTEKSDIYSFAVFIWEAYSPEKRMPYDHITDDREVCRRKLQGERLKKPNNCDPNIWNIMLKCWRFEPEPRPRFREIYSQLKDIQDNTIETISCGEGPTRRHHRDSNHSMNDSWIIRSINNLSPTPTIHSNQSDKENEIPCQFCGKLKDIDEVNRHQRDCPSNPQNHHIKPNPWKPISSSQPPFTSYEISNNSNSFPSPSTSTRSADNSSNEHNRIALPMYCQEYVVPPSAPRSRSSQSHFENIELKNISEKFPCEICGNLFDGSELRAHQERCNNLDKERLEKRRKEIEQTADIPEVACDHCNILCLVNELENHEANCPKNRQNIRQPRRNSSLTAISHKDGDLEQRSRTTGTKNVQPKVNNRPNNNQTKESFFHRIFGCLQSIWNKNENNNDLL